MKDPEASSGGHKSITGGHETKILKRVQDDTSSGGNEIKILKQVQDDTQGRDSGSSQGISLRVSLEGHETQRRDPETSSGGHKSRMTQYRLYHISMISQYHLSITEISYHSLDTLFVSIYDDDTPKYISILSQTLSWFVSGVDRMFISPFACLSCAVPFADLFACIE